MKEALQSEQQSNSSLRQSLEQLKDELELRTKYVTQWHRYSGMPRLLHCVYCLTLSDSQPEVDMDGRPSPNMWKIVSNCSHSVKPECSTKSHQHFSICAFFWLLFVAYPQTSNGLCLWTLMGCCGPSDLLFPHGSILATSLDWFRLWYSHICAEKGR